MTSVPSEPPAATLLVCVAGHIDHGKSRLVERLTGEHPDRLPEERRRGMTIELGFAAFEHEHARVFLVDAPGHERFIRTMAAGASGVDAALLVVAADDGVMPQTREHAEVLRLMGVRRCVVAINKSDLVDQARIDDVADAAQELVSKIGMQPVAAVATSAEIGTGCDELRATLVALASPAPAQPDASQAASPSYHWFRLPIDRVFHTPGRGVVVTGSAQHGATEVGDELDLHPAGIRVRVRTLQTRKHDADRSDGRIRLAVNLAGVKRADVSRGDELMTPGCATPTRRIDVRLEWLRPAGKRVRRQPRLRLHHGTRELLCQARLDPDASPDAPDLWRDVFAQLVLAEPIVAAWGQRIVLRDESAQRTLGGGLILRPNALPWTARRAALLTTLPVLDRGAPHERLLEVLRAAEWTPTPSPLLATRAGLPDAAAADAALAELVAQHRVIELGRRGGARTYVHSDVFTAFEADLLRRLRERVHREPATLGVPRGEWARWLPRACPAGLRDSLTAALLQRGQISLYRDHYLPSDVRRDDLPEADRQMLDRVLNELSQAAFQPPPVTELATRMQLRVGRLQKLLAWAAARDEARELTPDLYLAADRWREAVERVTGAIRAEGPLTVAQIRTLLGSSRKYVVPLVEALDATAHTRRTGDRRELGAAAQGG